MMRDVFLQIREDQEQLEHAIADVVVVCGGAIIEVIDDSQGIREKPFEFGGIDGAVFTAEFQCMIGAQKSFVQKMTQAEAFRSQSGRNWIRALDPPAIAGDKGGHEFTPRVRKLGPDTLAQSLSQKRPLTHQAVEE